MKSRIINLVGGPGCGKTVLSCLLFAELKLLGCSVEYIQEVAKSLVWTKQFELLNNQHYVTTKQYELLKAIDGKVEYIITDGSLLHGLYYNRANVENYCNVQKVEKLIIEKLQEFHNVFIHCTQGEFKYEQAGRLQSEQESKQIGIELEKILQSLNLPYTKIVSSPEAIKNILPTIV